VALVVGVVGDVDVALAVGGDGGAPVVGLALGEDARLLPRVAVRLGAEHDVEVVLTPRLPGEPDDAGRVGGGDDVEVRAGVAGDAGDPGPPPRAAAPAGGVAAVDDLPVAVHLLRPRDPDDAVAVHRHRRPP